MSAISIWVPVLGYEGIYEASNKGEVRSLVAPTGSGVKFRGTPLILKPKTKRNGYLEVGLNKNKNKKMHYVHRIVLAAFTGIDIKNMEVGHIDADKTNNRISNLAWVFRSGNAKMSVQQGLMEKGGDRYNAKLTPAAVKDIRSNYSFRKTTQGFFANKYGVARATVGSVLKNRSWTHTGGM